MKLNQAHICINCEEILTWPISTCPKCGSGQIISLARWVEPMNTADQGAARESGHDALTPAVLILEMLTAIDVLLMGQELDAGEYQSIAKAADYYVKSTVGIAAAWEALGPVLDHVGPDALGD